MPCEAKRSYPSRSVATQAARRFKIKYGDSTRPYLCACGKWHLTHLELWKVLNTTDKCRAFAEAAGKEIAADWDAYVRTRLDEIGAEIQAETEQVIAEAFLAALDRWKQKQVLKELGL